MMDILRTIKDNMGTSQYTKSIYKKNKMHFVLSAVTIVLSAINIIIMAFILKIFFDVATEGTQKDFIYLMAGCIVYVIYDALLGIAKKHIKGRFFYIGIRNLKNDIFSDILSKNINLFNSTETSKFLSGLSNDILAIETNYLENVLILIEKSVLLLGGLIAMIILNPIMFICVVIGSLLPLFILPIFSKRIADKEKRVSERNEEFVSMLTDILNGFSVIKCFKAENLIINIFREKNALLEKDKLQKRNAISDIEIVSIVLGTFVLIVIFAVGVVMAMKGAVTVGTITAFIQLSNYVIMPMEFIPIAFGKLTAGKKLIFKLEDLLQENQGTNDEGITVEFKNKIIFSHVTFSYEEGKEILREMDLEFERGKSYAIVGSSGSGKTTILNLLMGYHRNYGGKILIDHTELRDIKTDSLYNIFSIVQQNVFIFNSSIEDNITMFNEEYKNMLPKVIDKAGLQDLANQRGTDFLCGENGSNLSGGEKQRISIARSILKDVPIILMDEATATLDNVTSYHVENAILDLKDQAKIVVTHRLNKKLLARYDKIIVLKNGAVSEMGTFDELMGSKGSFFMLFNASAS